MIGVHLAGGQVSIENQPEPERPEGFALLQLRCAGICNTDLELQRGYYGFAGTPGHEFVADVIEADDASWIGKRVVGEINLACGHCEWCVRGLGRHCPTRTVLGIVNHPGAMRERLTLPLRNLHEVPAGISDEQAVFVEPLAAACEILDQVQIPPATPVALLGDGKLGLLIAQVLHAHGAQVHQFGKHPEKLAHSARAGIATEVIGDTLPQAAYDFVVDATGSPAGLASAVRMTRPLGTLIMKSTVHGLVPIDTAPIIVNELTLVGSRCGRFAPALKLLAERQADVRPLISDTFALRDAPAAFARAAERGVLKVLLQP